MHIKVFMQTANSIREKEILREFGTGVRKWITDNVPDQNSDIIKIGRWMANQRPTYICEFEYSEEYQPCDVAVIFGSWKPREKGWHAVRNSIVNAADRFVVIETPLLNRVTQGENHYCRIGINGFLNDSGYWPEVNDDFARSRLEGMNVHWKGWCNDPQGHILIALQLPGDASLRGQDINEWAFDTVKRLRQVTERPIRVRNHPLISDRGFESHGPLAMRLLQSGYKNITLSDGAEVPWTQDLEGAYCTVTYTSGLAIDSILAGIPTIACNPGNFAYDISTNFVEEIDQLRCVDKKMIQDWLQQLSVCQWSREEMQTPIVMQHLYPILQSALG